MKKDVFLVLFLLVGGMGMILWTFFGGSGENDPVISANTGFVEQLTEGDNLITGDNQVVNQSEENKIVSESSNNKKFSIMMPQSFYTAGRKNFAEDLYKETKIVMNFVFVDSLLEYQDRVSDSSFSGADLLLIPYDWLSFVPARDFSFQQDLKPAFDPLIKEVVDKNSITFLPFAADPMVTYTLTGLLEKVNFSGILDLVYDWNPVKAKSFPLFFGLISEDFDGNGFWWEYQDVVWYTLMHYFSLNGDSISFSSWIDSNVLQLYNKKTLDEILDVISSSNPECKEYPSICFQLYNFVGVRFGFISDRDIVRLYFPKKYSWFDNFDQFTMPFFGIESPVRLWGFAIPKSVDGAAKVNSVYKFLGNFMDNHNKYDLRNSTLSVFSDSEQPLWKNEFIGSRGYILMEGGDYIKKMQSNRKFWDMIEYKISTDNYLR